MCEQQPMEEIQIKSLHWFRCKKKANQLPHRHLWSSPQHQRGHGLSKLKMTRDIRDSTLKKPGMLPLIDKHHQKKYCLQSNTNHKNILGMGWTPIREQMEKKKIVLCWTHGCCSMQVWINVRSLKWNVCDKFQDLQKSTLVWSHARWTPGGYHANFSGGSANKAMDQANWKQPEGSQALPQRSQECSPNITKRTPVRAQKRNEKWCIF